MKTQPAKQPCEKFLRSLTEDSFSADNIADTIQAYCESRDFVPKLGNKFYGFHYREDFLPPIYDPAFHPYAAVAWGRAGNTYNSFATVCYLEKQRLDKWRELHADFDHAVLLLMQWRELFWENKLKDATDAVELKKAIVATRNFLSDHWRVAEVEIAKNRLTAKLTLNQNNYGISGPEMAEKMSVDQLMKLMDLAERGANRQIEMKPNEYKILK